MEPVSLTTLLAQLGLGGAGVMLMMWSWRELRQVYEARLVDLKDQHLKLMRLLAKTLKVEGLDD